MNDLEFVHSLSASLGQAVRMGDGWRLPQCPDCNGPHEGLPCALNLEKEVYFCHSAECGKGGHISELLEREKVFSFKSTTKTKETSHEASTEINIDEYQVATRDSETYAYLKSRGINRGTIELLDEPLREGKNGERCIYPFRNNENNVAAIQRIFFTETGFKNKVRRYSGKKGNAYARLKNGSPLIISEGLENGLSVLQHLGKDHGLLVCGDVNGVQSLAEKGSWAIAKDTKIIFAADNDKTNAGLNAGRKLIEKYKKRVLVYVPSTPSTDWNDVLVQKRMSKEWL